MRRCLPSLLGGSRVPRQPLIARLRPASGLSTWVPKFDVTASSTTSTTTLPSLFTPAPEEAQKPFYITTPIFYVNASPHIGHLHTVVLADVLARFARLRHPDREVVFATGTDEHGLKIQQAAKAGGMSEKEFCDEVSQRFRDLSNRANISYTDFIRTSEDRHYKAVEAFWGKLVESGDIYKGSHSGWYCVSDECFYSETQVTKEGDKMVAIESGNEVTWQEEENWKFKLPNYASRLQDWLKNPESIHPDFYHRDILKQTSTAPELSISRPSSRVKWGVPVPGDESQTIYVWVDALINYLTVTGYPEQRTAWPVDLHVVGKDIIRFHALHWPALLLAAGEKPPKRVLSHAHWTMNKSKMSKSRGNVADPIGAMDKYGVDGVRWYLMRVGGALSEDADYSELQLRTVYARLQSQIGNLIGRISSPRLLGKVGTWTGDAAARNPELDALLPIMRGEYEKRFESYELTRAVAQIMHLMGETNRYFTKEAPWAETCTDATPAIVYAYSALRIGGILAQPIIPTKAAELLDRLGVPEGERRWADAVWEPESIDAAVIVQRMEESSTRFKGATLFPKIQK